MSRTRIALITLLSGLATGCGGGQADTSTPPNAAAAPDAGRETTAAATAAGSATTDTSPATSAAHDTSARTAHARDTGTAVVRGGSDGASAAPDPRDQAGVQDIETLLRRTSSAYAGVRAMQAQFTMLTQNPLLGSRVESRGILFQRRPDRILLRFDEPQGDIVLADGRHFWIYYPSVDPKQVMRSPANEGAAGGVDLQAQFVGDPVTRFTHSARGREDVDGREAAVVSLVPREDLGYRQLDVWIDTQDFLVRRFRITEHNGVTRLIELRDIALNPVLADDLFRFTPPDGVRVVDRG